jgi:hypothetical protein
MNYEKKYLKYKKKYLQLIKKQIGGAPDVRLFIDNNWVVGKPYHIIAFEEFKKLQSGSTYTFDNGLKDDERIYFKIKRNGVNNGIYRIREDGSQNPIADFNDVKIYCKDPVPGWYEARPYQRWAYFNFIYSTDTERRYFEWDKNPLPYEAIRIPINELRDEKGMRIDYVSRAVDFRIIRVPHTNEVYMINEHGNHLISDDDEFRKGYSRDRSKSAEPSAPSLVSKAWRIGNSAWSYLPSWKGQTVSEVPSGYNDKIWFDRVFKFHEMYEDGKRSRVREQLKLIERDGHEILLDEKQKREYYIGEPVRIQTGELVSKLQGKTHSLGKLRYAEIPGDIKLFHLNPLLAGSLFQVASQFNALEMASKETTPEEGITIYVHDHTQGPACAMACPYGTVYRNYFSMPGGMPQTRDSQINTLDDLIREFKLDLIYENGYISPKTLQVALEINKMLSNPYNFDKAIKLVKYFIQYNTPVVDDNGEAKHTVSQIYCSALPIAYYKDILPYCPNFSRMILHAVYEATFACAADLSLKGERVKVFLTRVGGGVFGNPDDYINEAIEASKRKFDEYPIDVYMVRYEPNVDFKETISHSSAGHGVTGIPHHKETLEQARKLWQAQPPPPSQGDAEILYQPQIPPSPSAYSAYPAYPPPPPSQGDAEIFYQPQRPPPPSAYPPPPPAYPQGAFYQMSIPLGVDKKPFIKYNWEWEIDVGEAFRPFSKEIKDKLDEEYYKNPHNENCIIITVIDGKQVTWSFNFLLGTQTNVVTKSVRSIRKIKVM